MNSLVYSGEVGYTGRELRPGWIEERFGLEGSAVVAFVGSCDVSGDDLVDLEDYVLGNVVKGDRMLHFIAEIENVKLPHIVFVQRLLCAIAAGAVDRAAGAFVVDRRGDDLYVGEGKLSVSVATASETSGLIHLGLNITAEGVPVEAACLEDLGVDHRTLAETVISRFVYDIDSGLAAADKVRPVS
jgi:hypothetical protein